MSDPPSAAARWLRRLIVPVALLAAIAALHAASRPPDDLQVADLRPEDVRNGTFSIAFDAARLGSARGAVYLPSVTMNAAVFVNGTYVGDGGRFESPLPRNMNRPLLFELPAGVLAEAGNRIHGRVVAEPPARASLGPVFVGPAAELARYASRSHWFRVDTLWALTVVRLVIALFTLALWARRPHETYYGWYAALTVGFVIADLNQFVVQPPVPAAAWYWLWYVATGWIAVLAVRLITSFVGEEDHALERALWIFGVAGMVMLGVLAVLDQSWFHWFGGAIWLPGSFATGCIAVSRIRPALRRHPDDVEIEVAYGIVVTVIGAVLHDLLVDTGVLASYSGRYTPYAAAIAIVGMGWVLLRRFVGAIRRSEAMVADLEERVQRKRAELEGAQQRIREVDRARIVGEERERILRDIQDGIGARLISTLAKIEESDASAEVAGRAVRAALEDLRLMIDSLDPLDGDLLPALGMLRSRLQPRLDAAGVRVDWQVQDLPPIPDFGPWKVLRTLRILRGGFAKLLEHGGVSTITVRTGSETNENRHQRVFVEIGSVGGGAGAPTPEMERFAREIGAVLEARPSEPGGPLRLTIPL